MKNLIRIFPTLLLAIFVLKSCANKKILSQSKGEVKDSTSFTLIWSDEFAKDGSFDSNKWSYAKRGRVAWNKFITQDEAYAHQKNGNLVLRMDNKQIPGDTIAYHSGGVQSSTKFNLKYGKIEVKAKFTQGKGSWPAIWMMPEPQYAKGTWPECGEIDIMEHVNNEPVIHQTLHNAAHTAKSGVSTASKSSNYNVNDYNTYSMIWTPDVIEFYLNEQLTYSYSRSQNWNNKEWPYDVPFYIILNQAGGAGWPGKLDESDLPFQMDVDYVRVYDLPLKEKIKFGLPK
ncbi:glycoside hydrolase family 16 protein [Sphingobacterium bovistauri]|uniref:Glycoside hydrolase family 16 protein n=1 Tax=Sphingobacterium bovistauri TaxID=2781959 RepID=A0ABS7Z1I9_9SPHI|nr:glycoside hydrolase family 16 protein [Sphingobacterium bovistauri]MCA5004025.1 glycoside hydrolase family 16 protein [Sphingobacterium bovistauri]